MTNGVLSEFEPPDDPALNEVAETLLALDPTGARWAAVVRHTYDMIYNGAETGRYLWKELAKTEKTHFGTLFEINAQREFEFADGSGDPDDPLHRGLDYTIAGHDVDAKWSQDDGRWMLPPEVFGKIALVATGSDPRSEFSIGLIRVRPEYLTTGSEGNRDKKSWLSPFGRQQVRWLWRHAPIPVNVLLQLPQSGIEYILNSRSGSARVARLFRAAEGQLVHRSAVATVARQLDHQKRARGNGGARDILRPEGYLIMSGVYHAPVAASLGLPVPSRAEYIASRVVPGADGEGALLEGHWWRRALEDEIPELPSPLLPDEEKRQKRRSGISEE
ncbi:Restriction endonuclease NaeI [Agreia bicolorata]|uniref:Restriction endonuclease NaeI n=1 Tax=Agreia bicolorata TaxID=110935 RepID=A0A1T4Y7H5_9MICO|nr:NaeI family type II restriction endonuclease [Agreia bicolorata]SKA97670.1 Restriction endonuclease NaeI [Agreia bicolorata]